VQDLFSPRHPVETMKDLQGYVHSLRDTTTTSHLTVCGELKRRFIELRTNDKNIASSDLKYLINLFAEIDHLFFRNVLGRIATEEEHALYISAIGNFGQYLSLMFQERYGRNDTLLPSNSSIANVLFIIKGPFDLAHMSFVKSFIHGLSKCKHAEIKPWFAFLDADVPRSISHRAYGLSQLTVFDKLCRITAIIDEQKIGTTIWPSVSQNVSLYLGSRFAKQQIYWSARYRNRLYDTVDKYFFGARAEVTQVQYNGVSWRYGRFSVREWHGMSIVDGQSECLLSSDLKWSNFIQRKKAQGWIICATVSSERKVSSSNFRCLIAELLARNPAMYYFYTSRSAKCPMQNYLIQKGYANRFKKIDWIGRMSPILRMFDLVLDSFPVGASHALCYAVNAGTPFISLETIANLESSLLETVSPEIISGRIRQSDIGIVKTKEAYQMLANSLIGNNRQRELLLSNQKRFIEKTLSNAVGMYEDFAEHILQ